MAGRNNAGGGGGGGGSSSSSSSSSDSQWGVAPQETAAVQLNVTVPGNTAARVCLPAYLAPGYAEGRCSVSLDRMLLVHDDVPLQREGALLCWPHELSGAHSITVRCS